MSPACGAPLNVANAGENEARTAAKGQGVAVTNQNAPINQRFATLDEYLAYLKERNGPIDKPYYQEIRPGVYQRTTGNLLQLGGNPEPELFTREELERKFGFSQ